MTMIITVSEKVDSPEKVETSDGSRAYIRRFFVLTNSVHDDTNVVLAASGLPLQGEGYTYDLDGSDPHVDLGAKVVRRQAIRHDEQPLLWLVEIEYNSVYIEPQELDNPLLRPAVVTWRTERTTRVLVKDLDNRAVVNSTGLERFDPPIEVDDSRLVLSVTRNEAAFLPSLAYLYKDAVNADFFYGVAPGKAKIRGLGSTRTTESGMSFQVTEYEVEFSEDGFQPNPLDQGYHELDGGKLHKILDKDGTPVSAPVLLNGTGAKLAVGGTPVFLSFKAFRSLPFSALDLEWV